MLSLLIRVSYFPSVSRTRSNRKEVNHSDPVFQSQLHAVPSAQHVTQYVAEQNPPFKPSANPAQYVAEHDTAISPTRCPACCPVCCRARRHPPSPAPIPAVRRPISPACCPVCCQTRAVLQAQHLSQLYTVRSASMLPCMCWGSVRIPG